MTTRLRLGRRKVSVAGRMRTDAAAHMASVAWSPSEDDPPGARVVFARPWGGTVLKLSV